MNSPQQLAILIQNRTKEIGKTQKEIAEECEISKNFMQSMKKEGYMPRLENLCKLADSLDCSVDYLLGRTNTPNSASISSISADNNGIATAVQSHLAIIDIPGSSDDTEELVKLIKKLPLVKRAEAIIYLSNLQTNKQD